MNSEPRNTEMKDFWSYFETIDWRDPLFVYLGIFHLLCYTTTALLRNRATALPVHFCFLLSCVWGAEKINEWSANNWQMVSRQQYFDSGGMFISIVFSLPILLNCLCIVMFWLWITGQLLIDVKSKQLRQKRQNASKGGNLPACNVSTDTSIHSDQTEGKKSK